MLLDRRLCPIPIDRTRQLAQQLQRHEITGRNWAHRISTTVVPTWQAMETRIDGDALPSSSSLEPLRRALLAYLGERRQALEVLSKAALANDIAESQEGKRLMARSNDAARKIGRLLAKVR